MNYRYACNSPWWMLQHGFLPYSWHISCYPRSPFSYTFLECGIICIKCTEQCFIFCSDALMSIAYAFQQLHRLLYPTGVDSAWWFEPWCYPWIKFSCFLALTFSSIVHHKQLLCVRYNWIGLQSRWLSTRPIMGTIPFSPYCHSRGAAP